MQHTSIEGSPLYARRLSSSFSSTPSMMQIRWFSLLSTQSIYVQRRQIWKSMGAKAKCLRSSRSSPAAARTDQAQRNRQTAIDSSVLLLTDGRACLFNLLQNCDALPSSEAVKHVSGLDAGRYELYSTSVSDYSPDTTHPLRSKPATS